MLKIQLALLMLLASPVACATTPSELVRQGIEAERVGQLDRARTLHDRACLDGHGPGCFHFERLMLAARPTPERFAAEEARYKPACEAGGARACFRWGMLFDDEGGVGLEPGRALGLYRRACELGDAYACQRAAELHFVLRFYEISVIESRQLCERTCEAGYGRACVVAADMTKAGRGGVKSGPRSRELLRLACERGQPDACVRLAKRTVHRAKKLGRGDPWDAHKDLEPLIAGLTPSCELGEEAACRVVTRLLMEPLPSAQPLRATKLLQAACRPQGGASPWACMALAHGATGVKVSDPEAKGLKRRALELRRAREAARPAQPTLKAETYKPFAMAYWKARCDEGHFGPCFSLAGVSDDPAEATRLRERGEALAREALKARASEWRAQCERDVPFGCVKLAGALEAGHLGAPDEAEAQRLKAKADELVEALRRQWATQAD